MQVHAVTSDAKCNNTIQYNPIKDKRVVTPLCYARWLGLAFYLPGGFGQRP
jgi:hypothetical protein